MWVVGKATAAGFLCFPGRWVLGIGGTDGAPVEEAWEGAWGSTTTTSPDYGMFVVVEVAVGRGRLEVNGPKAATA